MATKFEIQEIIKFKGKRPKPSLLVRLLNQKDKFWITDNSRLKDIKLKNELRQPRAIDENGSPRFDLFELTPANRSDIENFKSGEIVELKPGNTIEFLEPWYKIEDSTRSTSLENELLKELSPEHKLYNNDFKAIAERDDCDDVLFQINSSEKYVIVHLTWKNGIEENSNYPISEVFDHWTDIYEKRILIDNKEYKE